MKYFFKRAAAIALVLILSATPVARASIALGDDLSEYSVSLSRSTDLTESLFWSNTYSDLRTERYITYAPNTDVTPVVSYGSSILSKSTLTSMARALEADGSRLVGGLNGDYFVVATGVPLGLVITDGVLRSSASYLYGVGFLPDGTVFIGQPKLSVTADFLNHALIVAGVNKVRTATDGYYLLTDDFSTTTQNTEPGVDVILSPVLDDVGQAVPSDTEDGEETDEGTTLIQSAKPTVNGRVTYVVEQVLQSTGSISIPEGKAVLTINGKGNEWLVSELASLQPGDTVNLDVTSEDERWAEAEYAVGCLYKLVTNGVVESGLDDEQAPRSAVGIKSDGTAVFYTIDGRQDGNSVGATLTQVASRLVELGCVEAACLDGGGSTTLGVTYPDGAALNVINSPSDGYQRAISNAVFFVSNLTATGTLDHFYVTPGQTMLLPGAAVPLTAAPVDTAWYPMTTSKTVSWAVTDGGGSVTSDGIFTAGSSAGVSQVTASAGSAAGSAALTVIATPDSLALYDESTGNAVTSLSLAPGQVVDLTAAAGYKNLTLTAQDTCFSWTSDASAGTVDGSGRFTAAGKTGTGSLTVSVGGRSVTIPVSVTGHVLPLEDFEGELTSFVSTDTAAVSRQTDAALVRFGKGSLKLDYNAPASGYAAAAAFLDITDGEKYLNLWVYGDGSDSTLAAAVIGADGTQTDLTLTAVDFTGWQYVAAALPDGASGITAVKVLPANGAAASGTLYLDQITTSNEAVADLKPPVVTLSVSDGMLRASAVDGITHTFDKAQISVTCDGAALDFTWDAGEGIAAAALPADDGKPHRLTVTATDLCGNIGRSSYDMEPAGGTETAGSVFTDTDTHWSGVYAAYLYDHGISNGISTEGGLQFQPDKNITRGEFFLMAARWLGLDLASYGDVQLPFDDTASIADWALPGVKAMYSLGVLKGSRDGNALNANAAAAISRSEAMTILGRIQGRGYAEPELTFDDAAEVPSWALSAVSSLVGQGVVGGYENRLRPNDPVKRGEVAKMLYMIL